MKSELLKSIIEDIPDRLDDYIGTREYKEEIAYLLTESENANGSWYCSEYKAEQEIKKNFELCGDFVKWHKDIFGDEFTYNPFLETENFHCCMMICAYENVFNQAVSDHKKWNEEIEINDKFIEYVADHLKSVENIF